MVESEEVRDRHRGKNGGRTGLDGEGEDGRRTERERIGMDGVSGI